MPHTLCHRGARTALILGAFALTTHCATCASGVQALSDAAPPANWEPAKMVLDTATALAIFFFGMAEMTRGMRSVAEDRIRYILAAFTKSPARGVVTGTLTTALVGSSSIVTIVAVGLVSAGLLPFANALGLVMGANIGTTVSSQLIAFGLSDFFGVVLIAGGLLRLVGKHQAAGMALMGVGFVFLGLEMLEATLSPLKHASWFRASVAQLENPWWGIAVGATITAVIQSSSATMGVVILMAAQGAVTLPAGIAIMMGAELGTCADTLVSTIGQTRAAFRTGLFHLLFNIANVLLLVWFAEPLAALSVWLSPGTDAARVGRQVANAHMLFNVVGVLAALPFVRPAAATLIDWLPDRARANAGSARADQAPL